MYTQWTPNKAYIDKPGLIGPHKTDSHYLTNAGNIREGYFVYNFSGSMGLVT